APDPDAVRRDMEIHAGAATFAERAVPEAGGDMRLVRLLVFRETDIAVDAVHGLRADVQLGRHRPHVDRQSIENCEHRLANDGVVFVLAHGEPLAPVVALQPREKRQRVSAEARCRCHAFAASCCWKRAMRSCDSRVRWGTMPIMRSISISWPRWCISCSF